MTTTKKKTKNKTKKASIPHATTVKDAAKVEEVKVETNIDEHPFKIGHCIVARFRDDSHRLAKLISKNEIPAGTTTTDNKGVETTTTDKTYQYYVHFLEFNRRMDMWIPMSSVVSPPSVANPMEIEFDIKHGHHSSSNNSTTKPNANASKNKPGEISTSDSATLGSTEANSGTQEKCDGDGNGNGNGGGGGEEPASESTVETTPGDCSSTNLSKAQAQAQQALALALPTATTGTAELAIGSPTRGVGANGKSKGGNYVMDLEHDEHEGRLYIVYREYMQCIHSVYMWSKAYMHYNYTSRVCIIKVVALIVIALLYISFYLLLFIC